MKKGYLLIIFTLLISSNILSCKNVKNENVAVEVENAKVAVESENKDTLQASYNSTEVANTIFIIPEVVALNKSIRNATDGKRGATILYTEDESQDFFELKVGDSNEFRFQTYYRFLIDHSTSDIYAVWDDERLFPLDVWNKINNIAKEYSNKEDSLIYIKYLSEHYHYVPDKIKNEIVRRPFDFTILETENDPILKSVELPFNFSQYFNDCLARSLDLCTDIYPCYDYRDNKKLCLIYNKLPKDPELDIQYFILNRNSIFVAILFQIASETDGLNYIIITLNKDSIISELSFNQSHNFIIYPDKIETYENVVIQESEEGDYDTFTQIANGKLLRSYEITQEGKIIER